MNTRGDTLISISNYQPQKDFFEFVVQPRSATGYHWWYLPIKNCSRDIWSRDGLPIHEKPCIGHCITRKSYISTCIFPSPLSIHSVWNFLFWFENWIFHNSKFSKFFALKLFWKSSGLYWVFTNPKKKQNSIWSTRSSNWTQMIIAQFLQTMIILCSFAIRHCLRLLLIMQPLVSFVFLFER